MSPAMVLPILFEVPQGPKALDAHHQIDRGIVKMSPTPIPLSVRAPLAITQEASIGETLGGYDIERSLGEGTMGRVFLGRHRQLGRHVALKVLRDELIKERQLVQRFMQEGRIVNQIDHAHIVEVYDFVETHGPERVYCVMEYLQGETLAQRMAAHAPSLASVRRMGREIASALGAAHAAGVVHRDLKPENIFLVSREGRDDWVKVLDFGIAKSAPWQGEVNLVESQLGNLLGTPRYMAPEQMSGLEVDGRTDVYALGTILYELVAGRPPFETEAFGQLAADIITRPPPPLPRYTAAGESLPAPLAALIIACLSKLPRERPPSMKAVESLLSDTPTRPHRGRLRAVGAGVAALAALALVLAVRPAPTATARPPVEDEVIRALPALAPVPPPSAVQLLVTTQPPGALVVRVDSGQALGRTPLDLLLARATAPVLLRVELPGYARQEHDVELDASRDLELTLVALPKPVRRPPPPVTNGVLDPY